MQFSGQQPGAVKLILRVGQLSLRRLPTLERLAIPKSCQRPVVNKHSSKIHIAGTIFIRPHAILYIKFWLSESLGRVVTQVFHAV